MSLSAAYIAWAAQPGTQKVVAAQLSPMKLADQSTLDLYWASMGGRWDGTNFYEPAIKGG